MSSSQPLSSLCLFLGFLSLLPEPAAYGTGKQPTIVVFLSDDHSQRDSGVYGAKDVKTPEMERIAREGLVFTHAFVASPSCAPSRSAMLTSLMPARNGAEANHTFKRQEVPSMIDGLQDLGYEVAAFGKVAHGKGAKRYGFDHIDERYDLHTVQSYVSNRPSEKPLCLFIGTHDPHVPWAAQSTYQSDSVALPPKLLDTPQTRISRGQYYTDVTNADRELGEIYSFANRQFSENLLFLYSSDHGAQWPFGKWNLYDEGIRVPLICVWKGRVAPGRTDAMVQWIDLLPTLLECGGGKTPLDIDGRSFLGVLLGKEEKHRDAIFTTHHNDGDKNIYPSRSVRTMKFKYIRNLHPEWAHTTHIDQGGGSGDGWRYFQEWVTAARTNEDAKKLVDLYYRRPAEELYDLESDPEETKNLAAEPNYAPDLGKMRQMLDRWLTTQKESPVTATPKPLSQPETWTFQPRTPTP